MDKRIIITESEKSRIKELHLLNEGFLGKLLDRVKGSNIYKKVERAFDSNPQTFVQNIIKEIPKLEKLKDELLKRVQGVNNMSTEETENYLKSNQKDLENNIKQSDSNLSEQTQVGALPTYGAVIGAGELFLILAAVAGLYVLIMSIKKKKQDEENKKKEEDARKRKEEYEKEYQEQNSILRKTFVGKTMNIYNDKNMQSLNTDYSPFKIKEINFQEINQGSKGIVLTGLSGESLKGLVGGDLVVICKTNPDEFDDAMGIFGKLNDRDLFYNKPFTDKLNEIGKQWCVRPKADFGAIDNGDVSNLA